MLKNHRAWEIAFRRDQRPAKISSKNAIARWDAEVPECPFPDHLLRRNNKKEVDSFFAIAAGLRVPPFPDANPVVAYVQACISKLP